jgi:multiple sugar transport system ATP-binding protein
MASIVLERVSKLFRHGRQEICALHDVSLAIQSGELLAVVGPSGSGKTTLLRLIAGLETPTEGEIRIDGRCMNGVPPHERDIALVFQGGALLPHMSVLENISFGLKLRKTPAAERDIRVRQAVELLRIEDCLSRFPPQLSTGQRQRVALARAMVRRPRIFLLDEPLANLDAPMRAELRTEITRLRDHFRATVIYVTHDQTEALSIGDRVTVLREGKVEQIEKSALLYARPANLFVARFIGTPPMNLITGVIVAEGGSLSFEEASGQNGFRSRLDRAHEKELHAFIGRPIIMGVRPEQIAIVTDDGSDRVSVIVERIEQSGADVYLTVRTVAQRLLARTSPDTKAQVGSNLCIRFAASATHFFDPKTGMRVFPRESYTNAR